MGDGGGGHGGEMGGEKGGDTARINKTKRSKTICSSSRKGK